ncbi:hypothetical protein ES703_75093 [subsurface metagenome]
MSSPTDMMVHNASQSPRLCPSIHPIEIIQKATEYRGVGHLTADWSDIYFRATKELLHPLN